jgi:predicted RNA-binding Zn-ribbon protein involved in translation (DUF1610 family)
MDPGKMICPYCGLEMNFHATKIDASAVVNVDDDPEETRDVFARSLREVHSCPGCGRTETRAAYEG